MSRGCSNGNTQHSNGGAVMVLTQSSTTEEMWIHVPEEWVPDVVERFAMMADNNYLVRDGKPVIVNGQRVEFPVSLAERMALMEALGLK